MKNVTTIKYSFNYSNKKQIISEVRFSTQEISDIFIRLETLIPYFVIISLLMIQNGRNLQLILKNRST